MKQSSLYETDYWTFRRFAIEQVLLCVNYGVSVDIKSNKYCVLTFAIKHAKISE